MWFVNSPDRMIWQTLMNETHVHFRSIASDVHGVSFLLLYYAKQLPRICEDDADEEDKDDIF